MSAAGVVTVVLAVVAVLVVALFLIRIGVMLREISQKLHSVIASVGQIPEKTAPLAPVLGSINADLKTARGVLEGLLAKKLGPVAQPDRIVYQRAIAEEWDDGSNGSDAPTETDLPVLPPLTAAEPPLPAAPPPAPPAPPPAPRLKPSDIPGAERERIIYRHENPPSSTPAEPPTPATPHTRDDDVIHYRRGFQK